MELGCAIVPVVSHTLFADDSYVYFKASREEAGTALEVLKKFEEASCQQVNLQKSSVFFSTNIMTYNREAICFDLHMMEADKQSSYFGPPNILGKNKSRILGYLK